MNMVRPILVSCRVVEDLAAAASAAKRRYSYIKSGSVLLQVTDEVDRN